MFGAYSRNFLNCYSNMESEVLSIEQMKELEKLGVDTSKASKYWYFKANPTIKAWDKPKLCIEEPFWPTRPNKVIPTFTLQDILELLPSYKITYDKHTKDIDKYEITVDIPEGQHYITHIARSANSLLLAAFEMLKWCKQNNHL